MVTRIIQKEKPQYYNSTGTQLLRWSSSWIKIAWWMQHLSMILFCFCNWYFTTNFSRVINIALCYSDLDRCILWYYNHFISKAIQFYITFHYNTLGWFSLLSQNQIARNWKYENCFWQGMSTHPIYQEPVFRQRHLNYSGISGTQISNRYNSLLIFHTFSVIPFNDWE